MKKTVFLDKDGTIIKDIPYNADPKLVEFLPGVFSGLKMLRDAGFSFVIVTNQSGVAMNYFSERELIRVEKKLRHEFSLADLSLTDFYYCPHHPDGIIEKYSFSCSCRKPMPGMIEQAAYEHSIDLSVSWMIGDTVYDVEAGKKTGLKTILVDKTADGYWLADNSRIRPDYVVKDFFQAAAIIARSEGMIIHSTFSNIT